MMHAQSPIYRSVKFAQLYRSRTGKIVGIGLPDFVKGIFQQPVPIEGDDDIPGMQLFREADV
jgi:hypothetical protein